MRSTFARALATLLLSASVVTALAGTAVAAPVPDGTEAAEYYLPQPPGTAMAAYGSSLDTDGQTLVVGSSNDAFRGAVHVFSWDGDTWVYDTEIRMPRNVVTLMGDKSESFGWDVGVSGDVIVVGEPHRAANRGNAFIFERVSGEWEFAARVINVNSRQYDRCGIAVDVEDGTVVVGATAGYDPEINGRGALSIFRKNGSVWENVQTLYGAEFGFGAEIDFDSGRLMGANDRNGIVRVYEEVDGTFALSDTFDVGAHLLDADLSGDRIVASEDDLVHVFERQVDGSWTEAITLSDASYGSEAEDVAVFGDTVCANGGDRSVVWTKSSAGWNRQRVIDTEAQWVEMFAGTLYRMDAYGSSFPDKGYVIAYPDVGCQTTVAMNGALGVAAPGVLLNDSLESTASLTVTLTVDVTHGTLDLGADGSFTYTPDTDYYGPDAFMYEAFEDGVSAGMALVELTVQPTGYFSGRVFSEGGTPLEGVVVRVAPYGTDDPDGDPDTRVTLTDVTGAYEFVDLPNGDYWITYMDLTDQYRDEHLWGVVLPIEYSYGISIDSDTVVTDAHVVLRAMGDVGSTRVARVSGSSRYSTSIECADMRSSADVAVLASGRSYPDALSASALAGLYDAPIVLTKPSAVPSNVVEKMEDLGVGTVFIVGGPAAVSTDVEEQLETAGFSWWRLAGADRYKTSAAVARHVMHYRDPIDPFVVRGDDFADALSVAPFAWMHARPVVLVKPTYAPSGSKDAFNECGTNTVIIAGGENAVSPNVLQGLMEGAGISRIYYYRLWGANRYATSAEVAKAWGVPFDYIGLASGVDYPDALSGAASMGMYRGPVLLTPPHYLHSAPRGVIEDNNDFLWTAIGFGGPSALQDGVLSAARSAAGSAVYDLDQAPPVSSTSAAGAGVAPLAEARPSESAALPVTVPRESLNAQDR